MQLSQSEIGGIPKLYSHYGYAHDTLTVTESILCTFSGSYRASNVTASADISSKTGTHIGPAAAWNLTVTVVVTGTSATSTLFMLHAYLGSLTRDAECVDGEIVQLDLSVGFFEYPTGIL